MSESWSQWILHPEVIPIARDVAMRDLHDQSWRLNNLYQIVDANGHQITFKLNLTQRLLYLGLWFLNIILKSRQHGITTFACILFLDICMWRPNISAAIVAHNREDAQEFFHNKIRFAYEGLPDWLRALSPARRSSAHVLQFANGSSIRVTTSGRSGTFQLLHISEFGKICAKYPDKAREIKTGTLNTIHPGNWIIIESTAEGKGGDFYDMTKTARDLNIARRKLTKMDYKFFFFPWFRNQLNNLDDDVPILDYQVKYFEQLKLKHGIPLTPSQLSWYTAKWNVQGDDMRREHPSTPEEAFEASVRGTYYTANFRRLRRLNRITRVPHQPGILVDTWWDIGLNDTTGIWFTQDVGREIHVIDYYENSGEGVGFYKTEVLDAKANEKDYVYGRHCAPPDVGVREWGNSGKTRYDAAAEIGLYFEYIGWAEWPSIQSGIEMVRKILGICWFDETNCTRKYDTHHVGIPSLENYRRQWDERLETYKNHPLHDWASNGADAFRTMGVLHDFSGESFYSSGAGRIITPAEPPSPLGWT